MTLLDKLDPEVDGGSLNVVAENLGKMRLLFPEVFAEERVDFDMLRDVLGDYVEDRQERYSFSWHGKSTARRIAQTPSTGTLRPCPLESVDWDGTQNLFVKGDNLEVLKLLQKPYHGRVGMIYIDPPYNTGGEFIYPDKYQDNLDTYLRYTGQVTDEGFKLSANSETSGRYHTNWLNMMYPRLKLARNLLRPDGTIFVSIDDHEVANLRKLMDELYGEENFVAQIVWRRKRGKDNSTTGFSRLHEYIVAYGRGEAVQVNRLPMGDKRKAVYSNPDNDPRGLYVLQPAWASGMKRGPEYEVALGDIHFPKRMWLYSKETLLRNWSEGRLAIKGEHKDGYPNCYLKVYLDESKGIIPDTLWLDVANTGDAVEEIKQLFDGNIPFGTPKPTKVVQQLIQIAAPKDSIVLDFFAGSATTADAVMRMNAEDGGSRRCICVQLPEPVDASSEAGKMGYPTIADIGIDRIRRAGKLLGDESVDTGVRVLQLDSTNVVEWESNPADLEASLLSAVENIKSDRDDADLLLELLLKSGLDLSSPINVRVVDGATIQVVGDGALVACLDEHVDVSISAAIVALRKELEPELMRVVFRDNAFTDDVSKTNVAQMLKQAGIDDIRSI